MLLALLVSLLAGLATSIGGLMVLNKKTLQRSYLAVALAFHAGLFNIGGEGQAYFAGLGVTLVCLAWGSALPAPLMFVVAMIAAIALTLRHRKDSKAIDPSLQVRVRAADRLELVKVEVSMPAAPVVPEPAVAEEKKV